MCAASGRVRARTDSLELAWPMLFSQRGNFYGMNTEVSTKNVDSVMKYCSGFIKLGLLARLLQVLLGKMNIEPDSAGLRRRILVMNCIRGQVLINGHDTDLDPRSSHQWLRDCALLLDAALSSDGDEVVAASPAYVLEVVSRFKDACRFAARVCTTFLSEVWEHLQNLGSWSCAATGQEEAQCGRGPRISLPRGSSLFIV